MKISIIVTTYNRPSMLHKVLEALGHQTRFADEVIVADDGSGPDTAEMIQQFMDQAPYPLYHVRHEDRGFRLAEIRNQAIIKSSGTYLIFMDGDCIPGKHFIKDHEIIAEKGCFFQGKRILIKEKLTQDFNHKQANRFLSLLKNALTGKISNAHHLIRLPVLPGHYTTGLGGMRGCNMAFFKKDLLAINGFNQDFKGWGREDSEIAVRLYKYGLRRKEHPFMAVCFHLWHEENDRKNLEINDKLLQEAIESHEYFCANGLVQKN